MNFLGIDYGEHRVGIAFADSEFRMAFSRETIDQKKTNLWERLEQLVKENKVDELVVGMPYRPDGRTDGKNVVVESFVKDLAMHFPGMPIHTQDEAYSSVQAQENTAHFSKKKKQKNKGVIDQLAAAIILQRWLDEVAPAEQKP
ncbi:Holliday junction resolvase RuvX [Fibrobacter sp. UWP2]|uniref:Holliday junction resolvase RuvX n=1 Tax=Fibrobacter sp. UWP2 TaxID=1896216 RepID=UPI00090F3191|nr:Holliday junction resolvase RuvX [Fibrobacter sp. UWP2]SHI60396.1 putative holliday junction resolvase [Fibrobacter sp. UWP2]